MLNILDKQNTILNRFIAQMRDVNVQNDPLRFRTNLERCGEIMAYEMSKTLTYNEQTVETPLGESVIMLPGEEIVIAAILRAGIPYHNGFLRIFDNAQSAFISAFRKYSKDGTFNVKVEYVSSCNLEGKTLILVDPVLATGASLVLTYKALIEKAGTPAHTHVATIIASEEGLDYAARHLPKKQTTIWAGSVDQELTVKSYVVPGLGDVGDLAYGSKL